MNPVERALQAAGRVLKATSGVPITYRRGGDEVELLAVPGQSEFQTVDRSNQITNYRSADWLILAEDLILADKFAVPEKGDEIKITRESGTQEFYEVMPPPGSKVFEFSDPHQLRYRVRSKRKTAQ